MPETDARGYEDALVIRAPVPQRLVHPVNGLAVNNARLVELEDAANSAHIFAAKKVQSDAGLGRCTDRDSDVA